MQLYNQIMQDMHASLKGEAALRDILKVIVGEFQRQATPISSDAEVLKILKKFRNNELETLKLQNKSESLFLQVVDSYLPPEISSAEIEAWIKENIDWSAYKNKMQAMGTIMKHFGGQADGNVVKEVLSKM